MSEFIPYGRQWIDDDDVAAVADVLRSDWLTTGPKVAEFEAALAACGGTRYAVAYCNGTAALHGMMFALDIGPGDEVIVPALTFAATANAVVYQGGTPVFADVDPDTLLMDPASVSARITARTRAIIAVDYAGQPCDYDALQSLADRHGLALLADACHALGGSYRGRRAGSLARMTAFSFHPVKTIACGEGGAVTTDDADLNARLRLFRNHGISTDHRQREAAGAWYYEMVELGYNYRLSDIHCALGLSQLAKLPRFLERRRAIARRYDAAFAGSTNLQPLARQDNVEHAYHLYVVRLPERDAAFATLRRQGIGVNVHYVPVHLHPFYRQRFGTAAGLCPVAEQAYRHILSLPIYPGLSDADQTRVLGAVRSVGESTDQKKLAG
ncbi:MAG: UDP-4-amino-4,6-dideoxy-N-acetyl-beta-L-altrosamine transaminase [Planctomycetia bacterium]|nr:UDP-4-amino-4,6-dideoxy-N-acetyl-beta-L-altrosamine transaminase [Planctomycetia bacterium]